MAKNFEDFKRLYPLSKTLRFEAKPIGATLDNIIKSGLLDEDEHRAASYVKMKKLIDEYHKVLLIECWIMDVCLWKIKVIIIHWQNIMRAMYLKRKMRMQ